ncbi:MAG: OPT/YSL family transporter [Candidatus Bathyarchaeota archaeon]|nr:OPT/YSL family transporter [Candidatus Bathyarchaeota archaeon]
MDKINEEIRTTSKVGLTWRSLLALLYITFVFQPGFAYMHLVSGPISTSAVQWATILLFIEICRLSGKPLTLQESIVIYLGSYQALKYTYFLSPGLSNLSHPGWIYQIYYRNSPIAKAFGIADKIPEFYAPLSLAPWLERSFFHAEWTLPAFVLVTFLIGQIAVELSLSLLAYALYVKVENLPYPLAIPAVDAVDTLIERDWKRLGFLSTVAAISAVYSYVLYVMPLTSRVLYEQTMSIIPVPWVDFNVQLQKILPGASLGIATDLGAFALGLIIPFKATVGMLIGTVAVYTFGNFFLVRYNITGFASDYEYGMAIQSAVQRSLLHAWAMPIIGLAIAVGCMPLVLHYKIIEQTFSVLKNFRKSTDISPMWVFVPFLGGSIYVSIVDYFLAPDLPVYVYLFLNGIWSFLYVLIVARGQGIGVSFAVPYVREMTIKSTGYTGINAWFAPVLLPSSQTQNLKICDMTKTRFKDFLIAISIIWPIAIILGLVFMQSFWSLAPIPSATYPGVLYTWPIEATFQSIFISTTSPEYFQVSRLLYGLIIGMVLYAVLDRLGLALVMVGIAGGVSSTPPAILSAFIGQIIGKIIRRHMGTEWWNKYRGITFAGVLLGSGLIVSIGAAVAIIIKSMWAFPY